jgi:hypothetical protein
VHDKKLYDKGDILAELGDQELGIADKGYTGGERLLTPFKGSRCKLTKQQNDWNALLAHVRITTEQANGRIKNFSALRWWRAKLDLHWAAFMVVCNFVNMSLMYEPIHRAGAPISRALKPH